MMNDIHSLQSSTMIKISILMTCHNRRETTLRCLESLYAQKLPDDVLFKVFLVDDGCTDGTGSVVKATYPDVQVIQGDGSLFWCNGMRLAWEYAAKEDPDFYLWLNDDVVLFEDAVHKLLVTYTEVCGQRSDVSSSGRSSDLCPLTPVDPAIIVGSTCDPETGEHTYGGQRRLGRHPAKLAAVLPQDVPVECDTFQGNVVLVPSGVFKKVGNMRSFGHAMGDTDYGLRAKCGECRIFVAPKFLGMCEKNPQGDIADASFKKDWTVLMRRLPPTDYFRFLREHVDWRWLFYWARPYANLILSGIGAWTKRMMR